MNLAELLNNPRYRPALAATGVGGVVVLALIAKKRAASSSKAPSSGSWVSAVPPANQPVVQDADVLGQALAGLRNSTGSLLDAVNQLSQQAPPPGTGAAPAPAPAIYNVFNPPPPTPEELRARAGVTPGAIFGSPAPAAAVTPVAPWWEQSH